MKPEPGNSLSIWAATADAPNFDSLTSNLGTDVCNNKRRNYRDYYRLSISTRKKVVIIDDGNIGGGETGRTTAHVTTAIDVRYYEIERLHGEEACRIAAQSQIEAVNIIEEIVKKKIRCAITNFKKV